MTSSDTQETQRWFFFEFLSFLTLKEEPDQMTMSLLVIGRKVTIEDQTSKKLVKTQRWFLWISNFFDVFGFVKNLSQKWYVCNTLFVWDKWNKFRHVKNTWTWNDDFCGFLSFWLLWSFIEESVAKMISNLIVLIVRKKVTNSDI